MDMAEELTNLEDLLHRVGDAAEGEDRVSLGAVVEAVGNRSFGPLLLVGGVIALSPLSGIPGMPTIVATLVLLIAIQLLFGRKHFWLPGWLLKWSVPRGHLHKALKWLWPPARFIDRWLRPRLTILIRGAGTYLIAIVCVVIAAGMPALEPVPFAATSAGAALTVFGLSLIARDGLLALLAFGFTVATIGFVLYNLL